MHVRPLDQAFETAGALGDPVAEPARGAAAMRRRSRPDPISTRCAGEQARAEAESALQRAIGKPIWTVGGGYQRDFGVNALVLLARVPLPLASPNQGGISRADAGQKLAAAATAGRHHRGGARDPARRATAWPRTARASRTSSASTSGTPARRATSCWRRTAPAPRRSSTTSTRSARSARRSASRTARCSTTASASASSRPRSAPGRRRRPAPVGGKGHVS